MVTISPQARVSKSLVRQMESTLSLNGIELRWTLTTGTPRAFKLNAKAVPVESGGSCQARQPEARVSNPTFACILNFKRPAGLLQVLLLVVLSLLTVSSTNSHC